MSTSTKEVAPGAAAGESIVDYVLRLFNEDEGPHKTFITDADRRYRAYRGVLEDSADAASFPVTATARYVFQVIETMAASLLDPRPRWKLRVAPRRADPADIAKYRDGTRANELLLNEQLSNDHFSEKQRTYALQGLITGITAGRSSWRYEEVLARSQEPYDHVIDHPITGRPWLTVPMMRDGEAVEVVHDDPTFDPKDIRDLIWQQGAISLQRSDRITERDWYTFAELKRLEQAGWFENVDQLKESQDIAQQTGANDREQGLTEEDRTKGRIEVLTMWFRDDSVAGGLRVVSIGNRKVKLRDRPSPFWFERLDHPFPFIVCSSQPDLFKLPGISEVEVIKDIQDMLWSLASQRITNLQLINNAVWLLDKNATELDLYPGAQNFVDDPQEIQQWSPNPVVASVSLEAEALLKSDLQNIPGASPALLGQQIESGGAQTATEVSLVTSLAQRRLGVKKLQFGWSYMRMGEQWIALNQQFVREDRSVEKLGPDGSQDWEDIRPAILQGRYRISPEQLDESLIRQERRAEQQAKLQVAGSLAGAFAASRTPLNLRKFMEDVLREYDVDDPDAYFTATPPAQIPSAPGGAAAAPGEEGPGGVTAPQASDSSSPSHPSSQSPEVFSARLGAANGGPVNTGG